jgi:hypothetical protein
MTGVDGALARQLEFGDDVITVGRGAGLRLAPASRALSGPDKYKVLDHRRHQAQIKARRLLGLVDGEWLRSAPDSGTGLTVGALVGSRDSESMRG